MNPDQARLTGRVAVVTGAAEGIGNAIANYLIAFGADVVMADIREDRLRAAVETMGSAADRVLAVQCDVTEAEDVERLRVEAMERFGRVDILVNNVGGSIQKLFMEMTEDEWCRMVELNLIQVFRCTKAFAQIMLDQNIEGSIINVTTIEAYRAAPAYAPYAAAKAGVANFTKTLALELSPYRIRVNSIAPDATNTPGLLRIRKGPIPGPYRHIPLGRRGTPEDFGGAAIFLASDLSRWITGEVVHVGGGTNAAAGWTLTPSGHWSNDAHTPQAYSGRPLETD